MNRFHLHLSDALATLAGGLIGVVVALAVLNEIARRHLGAKP